MARARRKQSLPVRVAHTTLLRWERLVPKPVMPLGRGSRAGILVDKQGVPRLFVFDTFAFLDVLSAIDERLVDRLSDDAYHSKAANPAGWLIDEIEGTLPLNPEYIQSLKDAIAEAKRTGWIPFEDVKRALRLE